MQTGDAELEMRGRCSAGQKVSNPQMHPARNREIFMSGFKNYLNFWFLE